MRKKYWTEERCLEEAKKYTSKGDFKKENKSAYYAAYKNGWLDNYTWFEKKSTIYWTEERCLEEAKKYKTIIEFEKHARGAYAAARKNKWIRNYDFFQKRMAHNRKWYYENCKEEAMKYKSRVEFRKGNSGAFQAAEKNGWLNDWFVSRMKQNYWNYETCLEEAKKYGSRGEFQRANATAYQASLKNGWINEYSWFKRPVAHNKKWTYSKTTNDIGST